MLCTHTASGPDGYRCPQRATVVLRWTDDVAPGWSVSVTRWYCAKHGTRQRARLDRLGLHADSQEAP